MKPVFIGQIYNAFVFIYFDGFSNWYARIEIPGIYLNFETFDSFGKCYRWIIISFIDEFVKTYVPEIDYMVSRDVSAAIEHLYAFEK